MKLKHKHNRIPISGIENLSTILKIKANNLSYWSLTCYAAQLKENVNTKKRNKKEEQKKRKRKKMEKKHALSFKERGGRMIEPFF